MSEPYKKSLYTRAVIEAVEGKSIRNSALIILYYLCKWSKADSPITDQSKSQIAAACGRDLKTVKAAMAQLREVGCIRPIARQSGGRLKNAGGRGASVVYRLEIVSDRGEKITPLPNDENEAIGGKKFPLKGGKNFHNRGVKNSPPNMNQIKTKEGEGAARGGGGFRPVLDVAQGGNPHGAQDGAGREIDQDARAEYRRALLACDGNAYKALALVDQWRADRDAAAQAPTGAMSEEGGSAGGGDQATALAEAN